MQLEDGDIVCFQKSPLVDKVEQYRYPDIPSFLEYVHNRQVRHHHVWWNFIWVIYSNARS